MASDTIRITVIPANYIPRVWPEAEELLTRMLEYAHDEVQLRSVYGRLLTGEEILLCAFKDTKMIAACILGMTIFETGKRVMQIPYVGGDVRELWIDEGFDLVKRIAKDFGCTHIRGCGRPGWGRAFPALKAIRTIYECEVDQ
jgi:hypothetical protein